MSVNEDIIARVQGGEDFLFSVNLSKMMDLPAHVAMNIAVYPQPGSLQWTVSWADTDHGFRVVSDEFIQELFAAVDEHDLPVVGYPMKAIPKEQ